MLTQSDYQLAIDSQSACNLVAVVNHFQRAVKKMKDVGMDTDSINNHPISRLYAEQISHLTSNVNYQRAYTNALAISGEILD